MQRSAAQCNTHGAASSISVGTRQHRAAIYQKARDNRKRAIRRLWVHNGRYYAQLTLEDPHTSQKQMHRVSLA